VCDEEPSLNKDKETSQVHRNNEGSLTSTQPATRAGNKWDSKIVRGTERSKKRRNLEVEPESGKTTKKSVTKGGDEMVRNHGGKGGETRSEARGDGKGGQPVNSASEEKRKKAKHKGVEKNVSWG